MRDVGTCLGVHKQQLEEDIEWTLLLLLALFERGSLNELETGPVTPLPLPPIGFFTCECWRIKPNAANISPTEPSSQACDGDCKRDLHTNRWTLRKVVCLQKSSN